MRRATMSALSEIAMLLVIILGLRFAARSYGARGNTAEHYDSDGAHPDYSPRAAPVTFEDVPLTRAAGLMENQHEMIL
ncbi:hypothetical protein ESCO_001621 [Escovopsis weberi]|uniref:Uncharacterized protein n=1 Tax=Escovopsis weberi TaxID=150374 RepID=A0A0M8N8U0_ESCWE|nr:hypothetical protein ESCO_001621 [Escovopsis weberi]